MAGWLYRNLKPCVDELIVCDPRRNAHVAKDGDKDDLIDAALRASDLQTLRTNAVLIVLDLVPMNAHDNPGSFPLPDATSVLTVEC